MVSIDYSSVTACPECRQPIGALVPLFWLHANVCGLLPRDACVEGARAFKVTGSNAVDLGDTDGYLNWVFTARSSRAPGYTAGYCIEERLP